MTSGRKALLSELQRCPVAGLGTNGLGFKINEPGVNVGGGATGGHVGQNLNTLPLGYLAFAKNKGLYSVALLGKRRPEVFELPWKVLMNKKNVHRGRAAPVCAAISLKCTFLLKQAKAI